jgi:hypothetical protein
MTFTQESVVLPLAGDPGLVSALLLRIVAQFSDGAASTMPAVPCAAIAGLQTLSPAETLRLGSMRKTGLSLLIDPQQLTENLRALRSINDEAALIAYFVRHGASRAMLRALFHVSHEVVVRQRNRLGADVPNGRPPMPDKATRDAIHAYWAHLGREESDARRGLVRLHQRFPRWTLVVLYAVIHEFDRD